MSNFLNSLTLMEKVYLLCVLLGAFLFLVSTVWVVLVEGFRKQDAAADPPDKSVEPAPDRSWQRMQALYQLSLTFFLMFGVVGLTLIRMTDVGHAGSFVGALAAGVLTMWGVSSIPSTPFSQGTNNKFH